jgi:surfeit locus 1 family protein
VADINMTTVGRTRKLVAGLSALVALAILLGLGTWQVQRLHWKEALLQDIETRRTAAPLTLAQAEQMLGKRPLEYRRVKVQGLFDHTRERHFFATHRGQTGYYIYTPLRLEDDRFIFINRGFVPYELKEPATRLAGEIMSGPVVIEGLLREKLTEKPSSMVPENDLAKNIFYWKDFDAMVNSAGLDPATVVGFFVDANDAPNPGGWPQGGVTLIDLPNNHLQYAITWYGLAAALVIVAGFAYFRGTKGKTG